MVATVLWQIVRHTVACTAGMRLRTCISCCPLLRFVSQKLQWLTAAPCSVCVRTRMRACMYVCVCVCEGPPALSSDVSASLFCIPSRSFAQPIPTRWRVNLHYEALTGKNASAYAMLLKASSCGMCEVAPTLWSLIPHAVQRDLALDLAPATPKRAATLR